MTPKHSWEDYQAAAAARNAPDVPDWKVTATMLGICYECRYLFTYGAPHTGKGNLDPCPKCGNRDWEKWGYRLEDGTEVPLEDAE